MLLQAEHQEVVQLKSQVSASVPAPNVALTCQGCSAVQEAVLSLQKQVRERDLASAKGSTKASSAPSTQDHSGDTLDDRSVFNTNIDALACDVYCQTAHMSVTPHAWMCGSCSCSELTVAFGSMP